MCPYVGMVHLKLTRKVANSRYVIQLDKWTWLDAADILFDPAYIALRYGVKPDGVHRCITAPNYGRYINTLNENVPSQAALLRYTRVYDYNVDFEVCRKGYNSVWVVANRNIKVGEEILTDYGSEHVIPSL